MSEPCCPPGACVYRPEKVRHWLRIRRELREMAEWPGAAKHALGCRSDDERPCSPEAHDSMSTAIGSTRMDTVGVLADLERAEANGCSTPEQIARYLCPWSTPTDGIPASDKSGV